MRLTALLLLSCVAFADPAPRLLASLPAGGSTEVAVDVGAVVVTFDRDVDRERFAVVRTQEGVMPRVAGAVTWLNPRTARIPVAPLREGLTYALGFEPEPVAVVRFKTVAPGEPAAPTVVRMTPEFGAVDVDQDLREVLIEFADDVRPGDLAVRRLRGAADVTAAADGGPYLKSARILAIPVRLQGGTTYGLQTGALAAKVSGRPFLPVQLAFTTKTDERGLIGEWRWTSKDKQNEMRLTFLDNGSYEHWSRLRGRESTVRGTWRELDGAVEVRPERRGAARIAYRRLGRDILDLKLGSAASLRFRLHEVVAAAAPPERKPTGVIVFASGSVCKQMSADGATSRLTLRLPGSDPWWSSDYATLVVSSDAGLLLTDFDKVQIVGTRLSRPSVTYDRKYAVGVADDRMAVVHVANGRVVFNWDPKKHGGFAATYPRVSPDGRSVVFSYGPPHKESLAVCSLVELLRGGAAPRRIVRSDDTFSNTRAAWSADGRRLAFLRGRGGQGDLYVVDLDGSGLRQVTRTAVDETPVDPCWSPDGRWLVYALVGKDESSDIWIIGADGADPLRLTKDGASRSPAWGR